MEISAEVRQALEAKVPVVALESTIIAHGMPYPQNAQTALEVEALIRAQGCVPSTIAVIDGELKVGLSEAEIERIGKGGKNILKLSSKDLPLAMARGICGASTVAATMFAAAYAGIKVFATGGIGGVHRGAPKSFDISADLQELSRSDVAVVCAGAKSILDLGLTLEYLETMGVPVLGFRCDTLPAFYCRNSGFEISKVDSANEVARMMHAKWRIGLKGGLVVANMVPKEFALDEKLMETVIEQALADASHLGIHGKELTPFLLEKISEMTGKKSLKTNIELVKNNALCACDIAREYVAMQE